MLLAHSFLIPTLESFFLPLMFTLLLSSCFIPAAPPRDSNCRWFCFSLWSVSVFTVLTKAMLILSVLCLITLTFCVILWQDILTFSDLKLSSQSPDPHLPLLFLLMPLFFHPYPLFQNLPPLAQSQVIEGSFSYFWSFIGYVVISQCFSSVFILEIILPAIPSHFPGAHGAKLKSDSVRADGDIAPVPLLTSPDLDALCDPAAPVCPASILCTSPPQSSSLPKPAFFSSPLTVTRPSAPPAHTSSSRSGTPACKSSSFQKHFPHSSIWKYPI